MKILLLSKYERLGASSRYRSLQYLPYLKTRGHSITVAPLLSDEYVRRLYAGERASVVDIAASYARRIGALLKASSYDLLWVEYEALPWMPFWVESTFLPSRVPYVVDLDDAVFHRYDLHTSSTVRSLLGDKIDAVMNGAALVIAGNEYLASRARTAGARDVRILPTAIDVRRFADTRSPQNDVFTVGWIGTPSTVRYLSGLREAFSRLNRLLPVRLLVIGAKPTLASDVELDIRTWSEESEVADLRSFDVGVMPLDDTPWERGKCGHKLIAYMASARAVVASPVGVNTTIVEPGVNGFLASDTEGWVKALRTIAEDQELRTAMGKSGRSTVERAYSLEVTSPQLCAMLETAVGGVR